MVNLGDPVRGVVEYSNALMLDPNNIEILIDLGDAKTRGKARDLTGAKSAWLRAIELAPLDPRNERSYYSLGYYSQLQRDLTKAIYYFGKAIELDPDNYIYWYNRAESLVYNKQYTAAIYDIRSALKLRSDLPELYETLGNAQVSIGLDHDAIDSFSSAVRYEKKSITRYGFYSPRVVFARGKARLRLGDASLGCADIRQSANEGYIPAKNYLDSDAVLLCG